MEPQRRPPLKRYRSDLRSVVGASATAYGYTLTVWSTGSVLIHAYGPPAPQQIFTFFGGAIAAFALVGALAFGSVTAEFGGETNRVGLWGSFHFLSVGLAVGAAWLASAHLPRFPGWPVGAFLATAAYLAVVAAENAAAEVVGDSGD